MNWNSGRLWLRLLVYSTGTAIALFVLLQSLILWQFDANAVRLALSQSVAGTGRVVHIGGDIKAQVFPRPGVVVNDISVTERDGKTPAAQAAQLEVDLSWLPLLTGHREVSSLIMSGVSLKLARLADGTLSIGDLFSPRTQDNYSLKLDRVAVRSGTLQLADDVTNSHARLESIELDADDLRSDAQITVGARLISGQRNISLAVSTPLSIQDDQVSIEALDAVALSQIPSLGETRLAIKGKFKLNFATLQASGENLSAQLSSQQPQGDLTLTLPSLSASFATIDMPRAHLAGQLGYGKSHYQFEGDLDTLQFGEHRLTARRLNGSLTWRVGQHAMTLAMNAPFSLTNLDQLKLQPLALNARVNTPLLPRGQLAAKLEGSLTGSLDDDQLNLRVAGKLDGSDIALTVNQFGFVRPRHEATVSVGKLDLNRYLPEASGDPVAILNNPKPIPLDWLDFMDLTGNVAIGELSVGRFRMNDVSANVRATPRELELTNLLAEIYEGELTGRARLVRDNTPQLELEQTLKGMRIRPLLKDLFDFSRLEGRGSGTVNLRADGASFLALRNSLSGNVMMNLSEGALTGIDLVAALKNLPAELKESNASMAANASQKTTFSTLSASLALNNGVARNHDLKLASQLVNLSGGGKLDLVQNIVDYTLDVRANPKEFARLQGVNVPLKITGPINSPVYALDFNAMVKGKKTEGERQQALKQELKKQIGTILP
ncbi:AsmA family protein [Crenobacter sp. SG2303]|uniref:AsmA family protein n=1 Tax=Crenobacter oryzisoli TaxID=3056844 RepID=A0ABT7XUM6_9NEIS|nr:MULTISPECIES: AsmA family protein [unclassified Crenobacter]MDN0077506.1 AsmA family protein [Crenobacter sp. SG2303]MDN0081864.1 AsmA family protein [Crenobacter sp. SG2305]